jgi:hypothetical protein
MALGSGLRSGRGPGTKPNLAKVTLARKIAAKRRGSRGAAGRVNGTGRASRRPPSGEYTTPWSLAHHRAVVCTAPRGRQLGTRRTKHATMRSSGLHLEVGCSGPGRPTMQPRRPVPATREDHLLLSRKKPARSRSRVTATRQAVRCFELYQQGTTSTQVTACLNADGIALKLDRKGTSFTSSPGIATATSYRAPTDADFTFTSPCRSRRRRHGIRTSGGCLKSPSWSW